MSDWIYNITSANKAHFVFFFIGIRLIFLQQIYLATCSFCKKLKFSLLKLNQSLILQLVPKQIKSIGVKEFCPSSINRNCEPWSFQHLWKKVLRSISYLQCEEKMYVCVGNRDMEHVIHTQHFTTKYHHILKYVRSEHKISVPLLRIHCRPHLCPMTNYDAQGQPNVTVFSGNGNFFHPIGLQIFSPGVYE